MTFHYTALVHRDPICNILSINPKKIGSNHPLYIKTLKQPGVFGWFITLMLIHQDSSPHPWISLLKAPPEYPAGWISAAGLRGKSSRPWCGVRAPWFLLEGRERMDGKHTPLRSPYVTHG